MEEEVEDLDQVEVVEVMVRVVVEAEVALAAVGVVVEHQL